MAVWPLIKITGFDELNDHKYIHNIPDEMTKCRPSFKICSDSQEIPFGKFSIFSFFDSLFDGA